MNTPRLSADQMRDLLAAYEAGERIDDIAERFGVSRGYIPTLARRKGVPARAPECTPRRRRKRK